MQKPTLTNVHIRTADDAHKVFYAVQLGLLPKIERRLDANERNALQPGDVYVWEKKGPSGDAFNVSMERFTEGKSWTASRVREDFLMYFENVKKTKGRGDSAQRAKSSENRIVRPGEHDQYIKQTYSVYRSDPEDPSPSDNVDAISKLPEPRKWHLNAYFTKLTEGQLKTIDDVPELRDLVVPPGTFRSARTSKAGKKSETTKTSSNAKRTYAPFPSNYRAHQAPTPEDPQPGPSYVAPRQPPSWIAPAVECTSQYAMAMVPPLQPYATTLPSISKAVPQPGTVCLIPNPDDSAHSLSLPESINSYTPAPVPPGMGLGFFSESSYEYASSASAAARTSGGLGGGGGGSDYSMSPSLSEYSNSSWRSLVSPTSPSPVSNFSRLSSPLLPGEEFPLMDNGMPYTPAPRADVSSQLIGPSRVDLAPLRSLRTHPYRRCPSDDRALRLLGPGRA